MTTSVTHGTPEPDGQDSGGLVNAVLSATRTGAALFAAFGLAYLAAIVLLVALFIRGDPWGVLASTRMLDLLMRVGIVARTDADLGFIQGIPDHNLYLMATDAVDWPMVLIAIGLYVVHWAVKGVQFHGIARFSGIEGSLGKHMKAYAYGNGISHLLPFNIGAVAQAEALEGQGAPKDRAALAVYISKLFIVVEITLFALLALYWIGWTTWLTQLLWAFIFLGIAYAFMRSKTGMPTREGIRGALEPAGQVAAVLLRQPLLLVGLLLQSVIAFALVDAIAYIISQAYTGTYVLLNVEPRLLLMGVVASYIARLVQITPGGIGQAEWGFAMALYLGGAGFGAAATIALLWGQARYISMFIMMAGALIAGVETNLASVLARYRGIEPEQVVATRGEHPPLAPESAPAD